MAAFSPENFAPTYAYVSERAEDVAQLGILAAAAIALFTLVIGSGKGLQAAGRAAGGKRATATA